MATKIVVVTGANTGLGYHCAASLSKMPSVATIVLACRNTKAANKVADDIAAMSGGKFKREDIIVFSEPCNLSSLQSVRAYAAVLNKWLNGRKITALVNNAGIGGSDAFNKNDDGNDMVFTTNHLGHFLLSILLLPNISERVVNVSSEVHDPDEKTFLPDPKEGFPTNAAEYNTYLLRGEPLAGEDAVKSGKRRYSRSKLCNILFTNELAFRLSGELPVLDDSVVAAANALPQKATCTLPGAKAIRSLSYNPGLMLDTQFASSSAGSFLGWVAYLLTPLLWLTPLGRLMRTGPQSGERLARLSLGEYGPDITAAFYSDESAKPSSVFSRSLVAVTQHQGELWNHSVTWAGITKEELAAAGF